MRPVTILLLVVALAVAGLTAVLLQGYMSGQQEAAQQAAQQGPPRVPTVKVLVARTELAAGSTVKRKQVHWQTWPESNVAKDFITRDGGKGLDSVLGSRVRFTLPPGTPLSGQRLVKQKDAGFLAGRLNPGMRAVSISVNKTSAAAKLIRPGDRVDIYGIRSMTLGPGLKARLVRNAVLGLGRVNPLNNELMVSETLLEDIRVLATGTTFKAASKGQGKYETITLAVTPKQAHKLTLARATWSDLTAVLRSQVSGRSDADRTARRYLSDFNISPVTQRLRQLPVAAGGSSRVTVHRGRNTTEETMGKGK